MRPAHWTIPIAVTATLTLSACFGADFVHDPHQSDAELIAHFRKHKRAFDRFARIARSDAGLTEATSTFATQRDTLFRRGAEFEDGALLLSASTFEWINGGLDKGIAHVTNRRAPVVKSLDGMDRNSRGGQSFLVLRRIEGNWYVFLRHNS